MTRRHERATVSGSLFRAGVPARLVGALALSVLLWAVILWAST